MYKALRIFILIGILFSINEEGYSQVNAAFTADNTTGCGTFVVNFINRSIPALFTSVQEVRQ